MSRTCWQVSPKLTQTQISQTFGGDVSSLVAQLLYNRGITERSQIESFLAADERLFNDPALLPDMEIAVGRIERALREGERIAIYGDFDADGITATTLLVEGISSLGGKVIPYIPHRTEEGYGLNDDALARLARQGIKLVVTVDCGISAAPEVTEAKRIGLDIVVTDHHTVPQEMPEALAIVDPKRDDSRYPFADLAGVGVAFKLLQALFSSSGRDGEIMTFLDLVAIGTVADMVSLLGENRYLVKHGLEVLHKTKRLGLLALAESAGISIDGIDSGDISWVLAPRLNAAGRIDHAGVGFKLLSATSEVEARKLASFLEKKNSERQQLTEGLLIKAREQLKDGSDSPPLLMVGGEEFHSGVVGVVAGRLVEEFYRPVVVYERGKEWSRGSTRSIPEFNVIAALTECSDLFHRFGGHPGAAGFTIATEKLEELQARLVEIASTQLSALDLRPALLIDGEVSLSSLYGDTISMINTLAPFGQANPYPAFVARDVMVEELRTVGAKGGHLKLKLRDGGMSWDAIAFKQGRLIEDVTPLVDIVFNLEVNNWRGEERLQLNILDFAPSV